MGDPSSEQGYVHVTVFKGSSSRDCSIEFPRTGEGFLCVTDAETTQRTLGETNPEGQEVAEALQHGAGSAFTAQHLNAC